MKMEVIPYTYNHKIKHNAADIFIIEYHEILTVVF